MNKKYLKTIIFIAIAYGIPWIGALTAGDKVNVVTFTNCMSVMPTVALVIGEILVNRKKCSFFHLSYLIAGLGMLVCIVSPCLGWSGSVIDTIMDWVLIALSLGIVVYCGLYGENRLKISEGGKNSVYVILFGALICIVLLGNPGFEYYGGVLFALLAVFAQAISGIGEEYAWRGTIQPLFQKRYGKRAGVLMTGVVWELWHACLWFHVLHYEKAGKYTMIALSIRILYIISVAILIGWAYMKTNNLWVCVTIHLAYNYSNRGTTLFSLVGSIIFIILCFSLLFTKEFRADKHKKIEEKLCEEG